MQKRSDQRQILKLRHSQWNLRTTNVINIHGQETDFSKEFKQTVKKWRSNRIERLLQFQELGSKVILTNDILQRDLLYIFMYLAQIKVAKFLFDFSKKELITYKKKTQIYLHLHQYELNQIVLKIQRVSIDTISFVSMLWTLNFNCKNTIENSI